MRSARFFRAFRLSTPSPSDHRRPSPDPALLYFHPATVTLEPATLVNDLSGSAHHSTSGNYLVMFHIAHIVRALKIGKRGNGEDPSHHGQSEKVTNSSSTSNHRATRFKMGKSNKFDYTNRPNSGAKLGAIIGGALQKEAEKVKKDAEKQATKARKQSTDSNSDVFERITTVHTIDLKAPNKDLGDEGARAMIEGMEAALRSGDGMASLALEDLNLAGNAITTISLECLAPVIELAKYDLKTLNLSGNQIQVETEEQSKRWETFLRSFKGCLKLRRFDLSGNLKLGARAMEVFARVHVNEPQINPTSPDRDASVLSLASEYARVTPAGDRRASNESRDNPMANARIIRRRSGLRSIPYITLHEIDLNDAGALWLSVVLQDHHYPNQLIDELNATTAESSIKAYQQDAHSRGIDVTCNHGLGKDGALLLEKTESIRHRKLMPGDGDTDESDTGEDAIRHGEQTRRKSTSFSGSRVSFGDRRSSMRSIRTSDGGEHEASDLERARKKIQRQIIVHDSAQSVELWRSALQIVAIARMILFISPTTCKYYVGERLMSIGESEILETMAPVAQPLTQADSPTEGSSRHWGTNHDQVEENRSECLWPSPSHASKRMGPINGDSFGRAYRPENAVFEVTNESGAAPQFAKPFAYKQEQSAGPDPHALAEKLRPLSLGIGGSRRFLQYQRERIRKAEMQGKVFRAKSVVGGLTDDIMEHIFRFFLTPRELNVMSIHQRASARKWGMTRDTLAQARDWIKKDESAQMLMLLDSVNCLNYNACEQES